MTKMDNALDLRRFLVAPGRRLVGMRGVVKDGFGVINQLTAILSSHRVSLRQAFVSSIGKEVGNDGDTLILAFLDVTDSDVSLDEITSELKSTGFFVSLEVILPKVEGLIADTLSHPLKAGRNRIIILRDLGYRGLLTEIRKLFGTGGEALLYHVGFTTGIEFGKLHRETAEAVNIEDPVEIFKNVSTVMFQWAGFGKMQVNELTQEHGEIIVHDSFECELGKQRAITYSQFLRGMIAGILAELFGRGFSVVEEYCIAKGDPVCRFSIKPLQLHAEKANLKPVKNSSLNL